MLTEIWVDFHRLAREMRLELEAVTSELTDPNDIELEDPDGFDR